MEKILRFNAGFKNKKATIKLSLFVLYFVDKNGIHFAYNPHLDLSGYGETEKSALESFEYNLEEFFDYTTKKKTFVKVLRELGWNVKVRGKKPKKMDAPHFSELVQRYPYVSEILDNYEVKTKKREIIVPEYAY